MERKTKKELHDKEKIIEEEKLKILNETDKVKGEQLTVNYTGHLESKEELKKFAFNNVENPEKKYEVYYKGISKLLLKYLPKGPNFKLARSYIYEEKNVYLTRGKRINLNGIRGADGRMGYTSDADEILKIIMEWILENGTMVDLYNKLRDINKKKGYGTRKF